MYHANGNVRFINLYSLTLAGYDWNTLKLPTVSLSLSRTCVTLTTLILNPTYLFFFIWCNVSHFLSNSGHLNFILIIVLRRFHNPVTQRFFPKIRNMYIRNES